MRTSGLEGTLIRDGVMKDRSLCTTSVRRTVNVDSDRKIGKDVLILVMGGLIWSVTTLRRFTENGCGTPCLPLESTRSRFKDRVF